MRVLIALLLLTAPAMAQSPPPPQISAAQIALRINEAIGQLATQVDTYKTQLDVVVKQNTELQKQLSDLKAKYEPPAKK